MAAAGRAFRSWSATPLDERRRLLAAYGARIRAESDELANLLTREQGKPLAKSKSEIAAALAYLDAYIGVDLPIEIIRDTTGQHVAVLRRPLGVVGAITAWNYPILLALWKIAPALATGNTIVLKPSPHTPVATLRLGEIGRDVLPAGVLNVIAGGDERGRAHDLASGRPQDRLHRIGGDWQGDHGKRRAKPQAADPRARRQRRRHRSRRCRPRRDRRRSLLGEVLQLRAGLRRAEAPLRA